eukprot:g4.t1
MPSSTGSLLDWFYQLVDTDGPTRHSAAVDIVEHLRTAQQAHDDSADGPSKCPDLEYALKRLVRGLVSPRDCARQGFGSALAFVLGSSGFREVISVGEVMTLLSEATKVQGSAKGQEQRDYIFGRIFGFVSVQRAGRFRAGPGDELDPGAAEAAEEVVRDLLSLDTKPWLSALCCNTITAIVHDLPLEILSSRIVPAIVADTSARMSGGVSDLTPSLLSVALAVRRRVAKAAADGDGASAVSSIAKAWPLVAQPLVRTGALQLLQMPLQLSNSTFPRMHPVWAQVLADIVREHSRGGQSSDSDIDGEGENEDVGDVRGDRNVVVAVDEVLLQEFWTSIVEGVLVNSTHERRWVAFQLVEQLVQKLPAQCLQVVLSRPLLRCLINNLQKESTYLHSQARHTLATVVRAALQSMDKRTVVVSSLLMNGDMHFDARLKLNTVSRLIAGMDSASLQKHVEFLIGLVCSGVESAAMGAAEAADTAAEVGEDADEVARLIDARRAMAIDGMFAIAKSRRFPRTREIVAKIAQFFMRHAFFGTCNSGTQSRTKQKRSTAKRTRSGSIASTLIELGTPSPPISSSTRGLCADRFFSLISAQSSGDKHASAVKGEAISFSASDAHAFWDELVKAKVPLLEPLDTEAEDQLAAMSKTILQIQQLLGTAPANDAKVKKKSKQRGKKTPAELTQHARRRLEAFETLFLRTGLRLLCGGEDAEQATEVLEQVHAFFKQGAAFATRAYDDDDGVATGSEGDHKGAEWSSEMMHLMLHFLQQPSNWMRDAVKQLFRALCAELSESSLRELISVVCGVSNDADSADSDAAEDEDEDEDKDEDEDEDEKMEDSHDSEES